jgi:RimJ/RimL family protein N-acetyltransferase
MLKLITVTDVPPFQEEVQNLFNEVRDNFQHWKDVKKALKYCKGHFFVCTWTEEEQEEFIGCLFLHDWNIKKKKVYLGGFSKRKNTHTLEGVKLLVDVTFEDYDINTILTKINKNNKPAQLCIKRAGFKLIAEINDYYLFSIERNKNA